MSDTDLIKVEELGEAWPDWKVRRSDQGTWKATRHDQLTDREISAGLSMTLMADSEYDLRDQLARQVLIAEALSLIGKGQ